MTNKSRSFLRVSVVPALLLGGVCATAQAAPTNWSDPATWPNRKVPIAGDKVTIGRDKDVILDVSPPALGGLSIDGKLTFSNDADLELTTEWIMLHGELAIGSEARPHTRNATITFTNTVPNEDVMAGMGDRGIMISGGTLNLHGDRTNAWTKLANTARAGSTSIEVLSAALAHATDWTDYDWQVIQQGHGLRDVAYFTVLSTPTEPPRTADPETTTEVMTKAAMTTMIEMTAINSIREKAARDFWEVCWFIGTECRVLDDGGGAKYLADLSAEVERKLAGISCDPLPHAIETTEARLSRYHHWITRHILD